MNSLTDSSVAVAPLTSSGIQVTAYKNDAINERIGSWMAALPLADHPARHPVWLCVLRDAFRHDVYCLEAREESEITGILPLAFVKSALFGRFLVSLPYLNSAGVVSRNDAAARSLVDHALQLAAKLNVRHLELRHEETLESTEFNAELTSKVHMRLALPDSVAKLSGQLKSKLRSQIKSGEKHGFEIVWGGEEVLDDFYRVFARNMRDLGTPVYGRKLFASVLQHFRGDAELCVLRREGQAVAGALLVHGRRVTEVPSASALRSVNPLNANMVMYWNLLSRAIGRGQEVFDFGRSTIDSNTFRFKKQWGAEPSPAVWQYHVRRGDVGSMRPDGGKFDLLIAAWRRLPLSVSRLLGPMIVRGIP